MAEEREQTRTPENQQGQRQQEKTQQQPINQGQAFDQETGLKERSGEQELDTGRTEEYRDDEIIDQEGVEGGITPRKGGEMDTETTEDDEPAEEPIE